MSLDEAAKRTALRMLPHPVALLGFSAEGHHHFMVATWLTQVSFKPPLVAVAIRKDTGSHEMLRKSGLLSINILDPSQKDVAALFLKGATFEGGAVNGFEFDAPQGRPPTLRAAAAVLELRVVQETEGGDHRVFVGEVLRAQSRRAGPSLTLTDTGLHYGG